ncbi:MAG: GNAT family N-acetyltransferase [Clostridiales bacterium]|nr:GNAT family N-acetyltransferase [Clostridiales bacterium]
MDNLMTIIKQVDLVYRDTVNDSGLKETIKQLWKECFKINDSWLDMYFDRVYRSEDVMTLTAGDDDNLVASSLLLQRYAFYFHSVPLPMAYVSGALTRRQYRDRGYMRQLMSEAFRESYDRGDALIALIPASRRLFRYYNKLGFSTVFYVDEERYTDKHHFEYNGTYTAVDPLGSHEVYAAVDHMLRMRDNVVLHGYDDFQNILYDVTLDGGHTIALNDENSGEIVAVALVAPATDDDHRIVVRELLAMNDDARMAALEYARRLYEGCAVTVIAPPDTRSIPVHARGMARIVNAAKVLAAYASRYPKLKQTIKIYDPLIPENSHIYIIDSGEMIINDGFGGKIDLDVTPEILLSILCSDEPIGDIFELPTARPYISMMMD